MNKMRYNLPTLLALSQDTGVHCKWTSEARHCRRARPDRSKKPILSEKTRNRPTRESARSSRPNKNPASKTSKNRSTRTSKKSSEPVFAANDAGFAQFLKKHASPKHQRVTAGGRIVPMEPSRPPHLDGSSTARMAAMNDDESIVAHGFVDNQHVTGGPNRATQENLTIIRSSTESDSNLHEQLTSPLLASTSQFAAPVDPRDFNASQTIGSDSPYEEWIEHQPLGEVDLEFVRHTPNAEQHHEPNHQAEECLARWFLIQSQINYDDAAIAHTMSYTSFDLFPGCDFYVRYVKVAWMCGLDAMIEAKSRLINKLRNHERYLEEVNEVIALDPQISPDNACYNLRVYNINERARVLGALDHHDMLMEYPEAAGTNNPNDPEGITVRPAHENPTHDVQPGRRMDGGSYDGANEVERSNINRGVDIIDPNTGHPIQFQRQPLTTANNNRNGTGRTNVNHSDSDNMQVDGSSELLIRDHGDGNRNRNRRNSLFDQIQVDRRSELFHDTNGTGGNVPAGSNDPLFDANSRLDNLFPPEMGGEAEDNEIISLIPQETWTERRPRDENRISRTLPRNFGRNINNLRSALHSITELDHEEHGIELTGTAEDDGSHTPNLAFSVDEDEVNHGATQIGLHYLQNEPHVASVSGGSDNEQLTMRNSSPGPGLNDEMLSGLSFDRQDRSDEMLDYQASLIPPDFFDVFVVDVEGDWEVEGSGEWRGRSSTEQLEDGLHHSRSGSFTLTMNSIGPDYPDDMSDTPLLSRNSPFGRYSPPLSRNSPSRVISRSSARRTVRRTHYVPVGGLSSVGSRMITSSLNARRRHDARENVRNARRSLTNSSRLIEDLRDEVPATTVLGFDAPDSQQNANYLPVYSTQLIDASIRHTAPAIVNTSRINAHAHL